MARYNYSVLEDVCSIIVRADNLGAGFDEGEKVAQFDYSLEDDGVVIINPWISNKMKEALKGTSIYANGFYGFFFDINKGIKNMPHFRKVVFGDFSSIGNRMTQEICAEVPTVAKKR